MNYDIRDISLAPSGHRKIEWVKNNMPLLSALEADFRAEKPFEGIRISLSVHLEAKTAYLCKVLAAGGARCRLQAATACPHRMTWRQPGGGRHEGLRISRRR